MDNGNTESSGKRKEVRGMAITLDPKLVVSSEELLMSQVVSKEYSARGVF